MEQVLVKFFNQEWDNCQGGAGKVVEMSKLISIDNQVGISEIRDIVIKTLHECKYNDDWFKGGFTGRGIISINLL